MTNLHPSAADDPETNADPSPRKFRDWVVGPRDVAMSPNEFMQDLVRATSEVMGINKRELTGPRQPQDYCIARQAAILVARNCVLGYRASYQRLGRAFNRDHATIMSAERRGIEIAKRHPIVVMRINTIAKLLLERGWNLRLYSPEKGRP